MLASGLKSCHVGIATYPNTANQSFEEGPLSSGFFLFLGWFIPSVLVVKRRLASRRFATPIINMPEMWDSGKRTVGNRTICENSGPSCGSLSQKYSTHWPLTCFFPFSTGGFCLGRRAGLCPAPAFEFQKNLLCSFPQRGFATTGPIYRCK